MINIQKENLPIEITPEQAYTLALKTLEDINKKWNEYRQRETKFYVDLNEVSNI